MLTSNGDSPNQNNTQTGEIYVVMVYVSSILTLQLITLNNNNMYNQTQLIMISRRLFPDKNVFNLTKQEQQQVLSIYNDFN